MTETIIEKAAAGGCRAFRQARGSSRRASLPCGR